MKTPIALYAATGSSSASDTSVSCSELTKSGSVHTISALAREDSMLTLMGSSAGQRLLRLLGIACAIAGFGAWVGLAWQAFVSADEITPESDEGGRLMTWALTGTLLMIAGLGLLHVVADAARRADDDASRES